ncbi:MAG TPA: AAA family ATPase [Opitutae bacterium]|nr:AAA family ATPase [Puniceicoccaceae bacterium]HBR92909.1 AAA family ATPase [Opitutae bacterium]|tara:strand:+ start:2423 stop:3418 length:996 start_codon:yes stop_codon:yes gene_type:complete
MNAALLRRLFASAQTGSNPDLKAVCRAIIEDEKRLGHSKLATELESAYTKIEPTDSGSAGRPRPPRTNSLSALPSSKRDSAPLVQVLEHSQLRHHMVLPSEVEQRFIRIEKEYAARSRLAQYGLNARKRILLYGPPGCGKSLGAERIAWATGLPLHKVRFDTLISSYFGETATNLSKLFEAIEAQPCALFLDECDTIARARGASNDVGEISRVVNMLLQQLEDYRGDGLIIAATNHYESLDSAIYRRFDEAIEIPKPGIVEIARLLKTALSALKLNAQIDLQQFAASLDGFSFSEVERIAQNAAKRSILANREKVSLDDLEGAALEVKRHF